MKTIPTSFQIVALVALASCANPSRQVRVPVSIQATPSLSDLVYKDVNAYRRDIGSPELQRDANLDRLAKDHCEYLREHGGTFDLYGKYVSHMGDQGRSLFAIKRLSMTCTSENVVSTMFDDSDGRTAKNMIILWKKSHDHDYAMRSPDWTHTGVGSVVDADGRVYATQLFSAKNHSHLITNNLFNQ